MFERHEQILEILSTHRLSTVDKLSQLCNVSAVTMRTDLNQLAKEGKLARTHGGARLVEERVRQEYTFQTRKSLNSEKKQKIGRLAASLIQPMESILLDSSTTAVAVAQSLNGNEALEDVTAVTTGVWTAIELMGSPNINVIITGGYLRPTTGSITGLPANETLKNINIQKAFLGAWGVSCDDGLTDTHLLEIEIKRFIIQRAKEIIVIADGSKFNQSALASYASANQISKLITDDSAPEEALEKFRSQGVEVLIAN